MIKTYRNTTGNKITLSIILKGGFTQYIKLEPNGYVTLEENYAKRFVKIGLITEVSEQILNEELNKPKRGRPKKEDKLIEETVEEIIEKPKKKKRGRPKKEDK